MAAGHLRAYHAWNYCPECGRALAFARDGEASAPFCATCGQHYYHNPRPVVACVALSAGCVLLVKRGVKPAYGQWALPGGFMEVGEAAEEAAVRELAEEAGVHGALKRLLGAVHQPSERYGSVVVLGYLFAAVGGEPRPASDALAAAYFPLSAVPPLAFESHRRLLAMLSAEDIREAAGEPTAG